MSKRSGGVLVFSWPDSKLSPNNRKDLRALTSARHTAKEEAFYLVRGAELSVGSAGLELTLTFYPPDRRRRDLDNLYSTFKAYQDGMFEALGVDDSIIERVILQRGNVIPGGQVFVNIKEA